MNKVAIIMGSKSDFPEVKDCYEVLKKFGVEADIRIASAHRTPDIVADFANGASDNGYKVIIAAAGKAAHLAGVIAGHTTLPVIGIPIKSSFMDGMDSLLSTVQMPSGIPVATVGINASANAGLLAIQMLALSDASLTAKLKEYKLQMQQKIQNDNAAMQAELEK